MEFNDYVCDGGEDRESDFVSPLLVSLLVSLISDIAKLSESVFTMYMSFF